MFVSGFLFYHYSNLLFKFSASIKQGQISAICSFAKGDQISFFIEEIQKNDPFLLL